MSKYRHRSEQFSERSISDDYKLVGVVIHSGEPNRGHYYSFIKVNVENDEWFRFDDDKVSPFDGEKLNIEAFGGEEEKILPNGTDVQMDKERNAYLLFYVRKSMLSQVKETNSRTLSAEQLAPYLAPNINRFREQNLRLFREASITNQRFHKFCENLFRNNTSQSQMLTSVCLRFVFNVICTLKQTGKDLKPWFKYLQDLFSHPQACEWLLDSLRKNPQSLWLKELLIRSDQTSVRGKVSKFLIDVCRIHIDSQLRGDPSRSKTLDEFLFCLLKNLDHWTSGEQVFSIILDLSQKNEQIKRTLITAGALRQLSLCLARVATVTSSCNRTFPSRRSKANVNQIVVILEALLRICNANPGESKHRSPFLKNVQSAHRLDGRDLSLVDSKKFYQYLLSRDVKTDSVIAICSHLAFENQHRFEIIQAIVLERLKWLDYDEFYLGLTVLLSMLRVKDSMQQKRVDTTLSKCCAIIQEQQFYWKATDVAIFCLLRASKRIDEVGRWIVDRMQHDPSVSWIDSWLQKKAPNSDSDTQTMYKAERGFIDSDDAIDVKRKKGDNLTNWKRLQKSASR